MAIYIYTPFSLILRGKLKNKTLFSVTPTQMNKVGREKCIHIHLQKRVAPSSGTYTKIRKKKVIRLSLQRAMKTWVEQTRENTW